MKSSISFELDESKITWVFKATMDVGAFLLIASKVYEVVYGRPMDMSQKRIEHDAS